jgi:hypothetical protein
MQWQTAEERRWCDQIVLWILSLHYRTCDGLYVTTRATDGEKYLSLLETAKGELKDEDEVLVLIPVCAKIWDVINEKNLCRQTSPLATTSLFARPWQWRVLIDYVLRIVSV